MSQHLQPFQCQFSGQAAQILNEIDASISISTYQAGKLLILSATDGKFIQLPRTFLKPMGIAEDTSTNKLAIACKDEVIVFVNSPSLAKHYPKAPNVYDSMFVPRATYHTGPLDIHDLNFGKDGNLYAVNTLFSCIVKLDENYNFTPYWTPPFIDDIQADDRCHLNGMAMKHGIPRFASAFSKTNTKGGWREDILHTGIIMDIPSKEVISSGLGMPHSPRIFNNKLYVLLSATGELVEIDPNSGKANVVVKINGFVRGMSQYGDYLFIGLSKLRKTSKTFSKITLAPEHNRAGISIVHLPSAKVVGEILYQTTLEEIYDIHILEGKLRPNILNTIHPTHKAAVMIPERSYWGILEKNTARKKE